MRIGIVTYWTSDDNYGQLLQCYALQRYLRLQGQDAFLIKYAPRRQSVKAYVKAVLRPIAYVLSFFIWRSKYRTIRASMRERALRAHNRRLNKARCFDAFREASIISAEPVYKSIKDLRSNPPQADVYICGSDQVWHDSLHDANTAGWFLDFGPRTVKRISYAASIGRTLAASEMDLFCKMLRRFDAVSVREQGVQRLCRQVGCEDAVVTLDPTMLLPASEYQAFMPSIGSEVHDPYVFLYILNVVSREEIYWEALHGFLDARGLDMHIVCSSGYYAARELIPEHHNILATIPEWIHEISCSEYVVTTSFHGTVFSILMNRPFLAVLLTNRFAGANNRIQSLLSELGLSDRIFDPARSFESQMDQSIDWSTVNKRLESLKQGSIHFLQDVLSCS